MTNYGSGLSLDEDWDFQVDETGDVKGASDIEELQKDLAFNVASALRSGRNVDQPESVADGALGDPLRRGLLADMEIAVSKIIGRDERIDTVNSVNARVSNSDPNTAVIEAKVTIDTQTENFEFVIPPSQG